MTFLCFFAMDPLSFHNKIAKTDTAQKVFIFGGFTIFSLDVGKSRPEKLQKGHFSHSESLKENLVV